MANIVLRNRNGEKIDHPGIDYLNVKTQDGGTQGYAAYDPETLVPENLASGVVVGDIKGALSVPQAVETTISPDFSAGNMEVVPDNGKVFSKVGILKPANLSPENIAKDIDIAGVVGTLESGGGAGVPLPVRFVWFNAWGQRGYGSNGSLVQINRSISVAKGATIEYTYAASASGGGSSSTGADETKVPIGLKAGMSGQWYVNIANSKNTNDPTCDTYTCSRLSHEMGMSSTKYRIFADVFMVIFTVPGVTYEMNAEGKVDITFDETAPVWHESMVFKIVPGSIGKLDLSNSNYTSIENGVFYGWGYDEIILPPTITSIFIEQLDHHINLSLVTSVPSLSRHQSSAYEGLRISVPSALYDAFLADEKWSTYADYIVAV